MALRIVAPSQTQPTNQMGLGTSILRSLLNPIRKNLGQGVELGFDLGERLGIGDRSKVTNPFLNTQESQNLNSGAGNYIMQTGKNIAGTGALVAPGAKAAGFKAGLLPGATAGGLQAVSEDNASVGSVATGAGSGALLGGVLNKLLGARGGLQKTGEGLDEAGFNLRKGVVNPQVSSGPTSFSGEEELAQKAMSRFKGTAQQQRKQMDSYFKQITNVITDTLDSSNKKTAISQEFVVNDLVNYMKTSGKNFVPDDPTYQKLLDRELALLTKKAKDGVLSPTDIFLFKQELGKDLGAAFRKESGDLATNLSNSEAVRLDLWRALDDGIISGRIPGFEGVKPLTQEQSLLYRLSSGLEKKAVEKARIPFVGVRVSTEPAQAVQDVAGRGLQKAGQALQTGAEAIPSVPDSLRGLITNQSARIPAGLMTEPDTVPASSGEDISSLVNQSPERQVSGDEDMIKTLLQIGLVTGDITPSSIAAFEKLGVLPGKKTEAQIARDQVQDLVGKAITQLDQGAITGPIRPNIEQLKSKFDMGDQPTLNLNNTISQLKAVVAKARAGTSFTVNEEALINRYTPNIGDSKQDIKTKLNGLLNDPESPFSEAKAQQAAPSSLDLQDLLLQ